MASSLSGAADSGAGATSFARNMIDVARSWGGDDSGRESEEPMDQSYEKGIEEEESATASMPGSNLVGEFKSAMDQMAAEDEQERSTAKEAEMSKALNESFC